MQSNEGGHTDGHNGGNSIELATYRLSRSSNQMIHSEIRALYTYWDASIVAASVMAMVLLSLKKVESWWLWILPVNVSAIGLYLSTEAYMFAALYVLFLVMAFVGLAKWVRAEADGVA